MATPSVNNSLENDFIPYDYPKYQKRRPDRILSVDGGGIRGIIPSVILTEIEKRTGEATCRLFDLMAGTSTGAIVSLGLNVPDKEGSAQPKFQASDIVSLYEDEGAKVFQLSFYDRYIPGLSLWGPKYYQNGLDSILNRRFGNTLFRNTLTETVVPVYEITQGKPWFFYRDMDLEKYGLQNLTLRDLTLAATAAPTYFPPKKIATTIHDYAFIDGGIYQNNPTMTAYSTSEIFRCNSNGYIFCSLGTGKKISKFSYEKGASMGVLGWAPKVIDIALDAGATAVHKQMKVMFPGSGEDKRYFRIQTELHDEHLDLDNASQENIAYLKEKAQEMIETYDEDLRNLCRQLEKTLVDNE